VVSRIDPKPPLNEETGRENLERKNQDRLVGERARAKQYKT